MPMPLPLGNMAKPCLGAERSEAETVSAPSDFFDKLGFPLRGKLSPQATEERQKENFPPANPSIPPEKPEIRSPKEGFQSSHRFHTLKDQILAESKHLAGQLVQALFRGLLL